PLPRELPIHPGRRRVEYCLRRLGTAQIQRGSGQHAQRRSSPVRDNAGTQTGRMTPAPDKAAIRSHRIEQQFIPCHDHDADASAGGGPASGSAPGTCDPAAGPPEATTHWGQLVIDASVAEQAIRYPTDVSLLNEARESAESLIDALWMQMQRHDLAAA